MYIAYAKPGCQKQVAPKIFKNRKVWHTRAQMCARSYDTWIKKKEGNSEREREGELKREFWAGTEISWHGNTRALRQVCCSKYYYEKEKEALLSSVSTTCFSQESHYKCPSEFLFPSLSDSTHIIRPSCAKKRVSLTKKERKRDFFALNAALIVVGWVLRGLLLPAFTAYPSISLSYSFSIALAKF